MDSSADRLTRIVAPSGKASTPDEALNLDSNVRLSGLVDADSATQRDGSARAGRQAGGHGSESGSINASIGEAARLRTRAAARVAAAYGTAHGHPTEHSGFAPPTPTTQRRWAMGTRAAIGVAVAVVLVAAAVGLATLRGTSESFDLGSGAPGATSKAGGPSAGAAPLATPAGATPTGVVVHVVGQVARPGLVELPTGSRVSDAVQAAGGPTDEADVAALNLARPVVDGEQIVVPAPGEAPATPAGGAEGARDSGGCININTADASALDALPGVGPVLAERIVTWRTDNGAFASVEDLARVSGIGSGVLAKIGDQACV